MAGLLRSTVLSLHRQVLLASMSRLQPCIVASESFHVGAGSASSGGGTFLADEVISKLHDKELGKPLGFINGEWVGAADGSTIDVSQQILHRPSPMCYLRGHLT